MSQYLSVQMKLSRLNKKHLLAEPRTIEPLWTSTSFGGAGVFSLSCPVFSVLCDSGYHWYTLLFWSVWSIFGVSLRGSRGPTGSLVAFWQLLHVAAAEFPSIFSGNPNMEIIVLLGLASRSVVLSCIWGVSFITFWILTVWSLGVPLF